MPAPATLRVVHTVTGTVVFGPYTFGTAYGGAPTSPTSMATVNPRSERPATPLLRLAASYPSSARKFLDSGFNSWATSIAERKPLSCESMSWV